MYFDSPFQIPSELLIKHSYEDDISILVGENGSGKSSMLNEIARHFLSTGAPKVIAVANTIHDKFKVRRARFEALKASSGKSIVKKTIKEAIRALSAGDNKRFSDIGRTMDYVRFEPIIGLRLSGVNKRYESMIEGSSLDNQIKEELTYLMRRFEEETRYENGFFKVNLFQTSFYDIHGSSLIAILNHESELKALKVIRDIEVYLSRDDRFIPVNNGSSGELTLITTLIYLMTMVEPDSIILIDEPENSLHPKWQTEYVKMVVDLLYRYQPKIIIATHSPLIVNSAELAVPWVKIFKGVGGRFLDSKTDVRNVEEIYQDFFDVTTPENRYLSQDITKKMNQLADGEIAISEFERVINEFSNNAYDDKQKDVLTNVIEMGRKIIANR